MQPVTYKASDRKALQRGLEAMDELILHLQA